MRSVTRLLDRRSFLPLYVQIQRTLREQIRSGAIRAGAAVPSERDLSERYGVSRMTVRQAMRALRQEGFLYREYGRGLFVTPRKVDVHTRNLVGFSEDMRQRGLRPSSQLIRLRREQPPGDVAADLNLEPGTEVFHLERLRLANGTPMAYESTFLPAALCPDLERYDLAHDSLYRILQEECGLRFERAREVLEAAAGGRRIARLFRTRPSAPVLVVRRVVYTNDNRPVELATTMYRADHYRATFHVTATGM